jgi:uncharacterized protein YbaA (DUF1428 family)
MKKENKEKMGYVDGFILSVPEKRLKEYFKIAAGAGKIWKEHGALDYKECVADDMNAHGMMPFTKSVKMKPGEVVVFAYIVFKSAAHRKQVNARVMKDPRVHALCDPKNMPFDMKRMVYGGFKIKVDA